MRKQSDEYSLKLVRRILSGSRTISVVMTRTRIEARAAASH